MIGRKIAEEARWTKCERMSGQKEERDRDVSGGLVMKRKKGSFPQPAGERERKKENS